MSARRVVGRREREADHRRDAVALETQRDPVPRAQAADDGEAQADTRAGLAFDERLERRVARPQEGLIVVAYRAKASKADAQPYDAHCTSTYRRLGHDHWVVVQHQQTPPLIVGGE